MDDESKVSHLVLPDRADAKAQFKLVNKSIGFCKHIALTVDEDNRIVQCSRCDKVLDPFDWLLKSAEREQRIYQNAISVDNETKVRRKAIKELDRVERNYKARVRNIKKKTNDPILNGIEELIDSLQRAWRDDDELKVKHFIKYLKKLAGLAAC